MYVDVGDLNEGARAPAPAAGVAEVPHIPPVVVDRAGAPVQVVREPAANREADAERPEATREAAAEDRPGVDDVRVVDRHIDQPRLGRRDDVVAIVADHGLLRRRSQVALRVGQRAQTLHRRHHIARLRGVGAAKCRCPVELVGHHVDRRRVVGHRLHAHIPRLVIDAVGAVGPHMTRRLLDLIGEGGRHQHLRQQRVRVQRDRTDEVVELFARKAVLLAFGAVPGPAVLRHGRRGRRHCDHRDGGVQREGPTDHGATPGRDTNGAVEREKCIGRTQTNLVVGQRLTVIQPPRSPRFRTPRCPEWTVAPAAVGKGRRR